MARYGVGMVIVYTIRPGPILYISRGLDVTGLAFSRTTASGIRHYSRGHIVYQPGAYCTRLLTLVYISQGVVVYQAVLRGTTPHHTPSPLWNSKPLRLVRGQGFCLLLRQWGSGYGPAGLIYLIFSLILWHNPGAGVILLGQPVSAS